jgi:molecular chaperone GrpE
MDPKQKIEDLEQIEETETDETGSVDDFIKQLEEKEKDLHITAETTVIELAESFEGGEIPDFVKGEFAFSPSAVVTPAAAAPAPVEAKKTGEGETKIAELKEKLAKSDADRAEMQKDSQRRARDFENYKSRTERERSETFEKLVGNLATKMLPALDNLHRAVDFARNLPEEKRADLQQFFDGIELVNQQVNEVLAGMGIQQIATVGEAFDPHYHEAVATEESDEYPANTISAELLRGYCIGERVIRHSMVKVSTTSSKQDPDETSEGADNASSADAEESTTPSAEAADSPP